MFYSYASNLAPNDTNNATDIFLRDRQAGFTQKINVGINGTEANGISLSPSISADGSYIVFSSLASNLVSGDTNDTGDIFTYNLGSNTLERISLTNSEAELDSNSIRPSISADGRYVLFQSRATNLGLVNSDSYSNIYLRDQFTGKTKLVNFTLDRQIYGDSINSSISIDGEYITFESIGINDNSINDIFVTETIDLTNVDEFDVTPSTDTDTTTNTIVENATNGSTVGITATAIDDDSSNNTVTYSLTDNAEGRFEINSTTGVVTVADGSLLNFEAATSHTISVKATSSDTSESTQSFTIEVTDVNEVPTAVTLDNAVTTIAENTSTVTRIKVADITVTDDALGTETIALTGADAASFEVDGTELYLKAGTTLDFETKSSYAVTVEVDDTTIGTTPDVSTNFTLTVSNVNEAPTAVSLGNQQTTIAENTSTTTRIKVADITVTDDALGTETIVLTGVDAESFEANTTGLYLKAGVVLDYETKSSYNVTVEINDTTIGNTPDASTSFTLTVTDINEILPSIISATPRADTLIAGEHFHRSRE